MPSTSNRKLAFVAGLRAAGPAGAWLAVTAALVFWRVSEFYVWLAIGSIVGTVVVFLGALLAYRSTVSANPRRWTPLRYRIESLESEIRSASSPNSSESEATERAGSHLTQVKTLLGEKGPQWVSGEGYVDLSRGVHSLEEDVLDWASSRALFEVAQTDGFRLSDSDIPESNRTKLIEQLTQPRQDLETNAKDETKADKQPTPWITASVKDVHHALNEYRDSIREGIVRLVINTLDAAAVSGVLVYVLLVDVKVYQTAQPVAAGVAFFLIGALVGLLSALQALSQSGSAADDFGLSSVRLLTIPILSGLTGLAGTLLYSLLAPTGVEKLGLGQIFDVVNHPFGIVLAAVSGLAPSLVLRGLNSLAQRYSDGLTSTQSASSAPQR